MDWYLSRKGERRGPFDDPQFRKLLESGEIKPDDLVWHRGLTEWRRAESLTGLSSPPPIPGDGLQDVASAEREAVLQIAEKDSNEEHSAVESPPGYEPTQAILSSPPKKSYFVRHWRGELSLGVSYWINWSLLSSVLLADQQSCSNL